MRKTFKKTVKHRAGKRIGSVILAMALAVSFMPSLSGNILADDDESALSGMAAAADESSSEEENLLSQEEYGVSADDIYAEPAGDTETGSNEDALPDDGSIALSDIVFDDDDPETFAEDGILDITVEEDAGLEEDGAEQEDAFVPDTVESPDAETADTEKSQEEDLPGSGNTERLYIPYILEKMGVSTDESSDSEGLLYAADNTNFKYLGVIPANRHDVTITTNGNTVIINGTVSGTWSFVNLWVDGEEVVKQFSGTQKKKLANFSFNLNDYVDTGYHTVSIGVSSTEKNPDGSYKADLIGRKYVASNTITDSPTSNGVFDVYSSYFNYYPYGSFSNTAGTLYMEYSENGGASWQRSGYMKYNLITTASQQGYRIGGLKPKTTYMTRIRYGSYITYSPTFEGDGNSYFFGGPVLNTTTIKTGSSSKPKIKSVTLKATKVKHHKLRWPGYYNVVGGSVFWHNSYVEKFYTAKVKVTVKLKKKPGTNGVFISLLGQTKWKKGNKKKYTVTFTPTYNYWVKNPHSGKYKLQVQVYSGQNSSWGGYSPAWSKKKKVR